MKEDVAKVFEQIKNEPDYLAKARLLHFLKREKDVAIKTMAQETGYKESYVCHLLRLLKLPEIVIDGYYAKMISLSHLFIIGRLKNETQMVQAYETILTDSLTAAQTEHLVRNILYEVTPEGERISAAELERLQSVVAQIDPHASVSVIQTRIKTKFQIEIKGNLKQGSEVLRKIMQRLTSE